MILAYAAERVRPWVFGPLAAVLAAAATSGAWRASAIVVDAAFALSLLAQFRTWDDLADRGHDALVQPDRVIVSGASVTPIVGVCVVLGGVNILLALWRDGWGVAVAVLVALNALLAAWYDRRGGRTAAGDHLLLAKYPAIVAVVAGGRIVAAPLRIGLAAAGVYLAANLYEAFHDTASPAAGLPWLVACEAALLLVIVIAFAAFGGRS